MFLFIILDQLNNVVSHCLERSRPHILVAELIEGILSSDHDEKTVTEEREMFIAKKIDTSAMAVISSTLLDIRPTIVGIKARMDAPADQRAG